MKTKMRFVVFVYRGEDKLCEHWAWSRQGAKETAKLLTQHDQTIIVEIFELTPCN